VYKIVDGEARPQRVETGISDELHVEIVSGLTVGDEVITGPYRTLKALHNGDRVSVKKAGDTSDDDEEATADDEESDD
jgi:HlyD family secretion protein